MGGTECDATSIDGFFGSRQVAISHQPQVGAWVVDRQVSSPEEERDFLFCSAGV